MNTEIRKITRNIKREADSLISKQAMKTLQAKLDELDIDFDKLSFDKKERMLNKEKKRVKQRAKDVGSGASIASVVSFLLFGF